MTTITLETYSGHRYSGTLIGIWRQLAADLSVAGPRSLTVREPLDQIATEASQCSIHETQRVVTASLYDGEDRILDALGRKLDIDAMYKRAVQS